MNIEVIFTLVKGKKVKVQCSKDFGETIKEDIANPDVTFIDLDTIFINKEHLVNVRFLTK